jgi:exodeoxyribonuclease X
MELSKTLIFLDVESTGKDLEDRLIQIAYKTTDDAPLVNELYTAPLPIKIEAMAVHHITEKMIEGKPAFIGSPAYDDLTERFARGEIFVAHNAPFDAEMLRKEGLEPKLLIDTLKVARHLDPEGKISSYGLQYLRYLLGIEIEATAHDALGDILVLEQLFYRLLKKIMETQHISQDTALDQMIDISNNPTIYKFFPFGKYKNRSVEDIAKEDRGYLEWLLRTKKAEDQKDEDWIYTLEQILG